ncbi:MAG: polysaccharide pyruvyl transferase family protein [Myxococcota bacterium]
MTRPLRVGISGSYGGLNLGDEAILQVILRDLRESLPVEVTVFSRDPTDTLRRHHVEHAVPARRLSRKETVSVIESLDLFILGGGGILYEADAESYLREVVVAREKNVPVMVYAVSVGPLLSPFTRALVRDVLGGVAVITVRDRPSRQLLDEIGLQKEITVTADPALLLAPEPLTLEEILRAEAIDPDANLIGLSVREPGPAAPDLDVEHYHQLLANAADFMVDRYDAETVFIPMERRVFDVQHSHGVVSRMRHAQHATVLKREYTSGQVLSLLGHFRFCVGMRLHFLIFSALADVPFVALPYAPKVTGFLEELDLEAPAIGQVSAGQLIAHVDRAWDTREQRRARVREALPGLQARARRNHEIVSRLLAEVRAAAPVSV